MEQTMSTGLQKHFEYLKRKRSFWHRLLFGPREPSYYEGPAGFTLATETKQVAFLGSMTAEERDDPRRVCDDRLLRIAKGSGLTMHEAELLHQFYLAVFMQMPSPRRARREDD